MKKITYYALSVLTLAGILLNGCKKDPLSLQKTATVSTIASGPNYLYITVDKSDNIYALRPGSVDTIFKITQSGDKSVFYVPPTTMDHDTVVYHKMLCLTTDSAGNIYTVAFNGLTNPDVIKISPTGTASTLYTDISMSYYEYDTKIAVDPQGNFYYSNPNGINKISTSGAASQIIPGATTFTPDAYGNIYYVGPHQSSVIKLSTSGVTTTIGAGQITGVILDLGADVYGNVYVSSAAENNVTATIQKITKRDSVKTVISSAPGHADGPLNSAQISSITSQVTDRTGNLYFIDTYYKTYIRKITF